MPQTTLVQARFTTPHNEMVNTFAFHDEVAGDSSLHQTVCRDAVREFYETVAVPGGSAIGHMMASWTERNYEVRSYDFAQAKPRVPTIRNWTLPTASGTSATQHVPMDTALCLSYRGAPPVTRRKRGRIYLGGVTDSWMGGGSPDVPPQFQTGTGSAVTTIIAAANRLRVVVGAGWSIWSRAGNMFTPIVGGFIDLEPDTQRRRGSDSSAVGRQEWDA